MTSTKKRAKKLKFHLITLMPKKEVERVKYEWLSAYHKGKNPPSLTTLKGFEAHYKEFEIFEKEHRR